jgi:hypothetical protein
VSKNPNPKKLPENTPFPHKPLTISISDENFSLAAAKWAMIIRLTKWKKLRKICSS